MPDVSLPPTDLAYLNERIENFQVATESGMICIVIPQWSLPRGLNHGASDLLIRLSPGYPDVAPDMWWFSPPVHRADGKELPNTHVVETYLGHSWQRWSRHFSAGQWESGVDGLESFLALIRQELARSVPESVR